eukprot:673510-Amphidinium_carterae.1
MISVCVVFELWGGDTIFCPGVTRWLPLHIVEWAFLHCECAGLGTDSSTKAAWSADQTLTQLNGLGLIAESASWAEVASLILHSYG